MNQDLETYTFPIEVAFYKISNTVKTFAIWMKNFEFYTVNDLFISVTYFFGF